MPDLQRLSGSEGSACYRKKGRGTQSPWFGGGLGHRILGQSVTAYGKHPGSPPPQTLAASMHTDLVVQPEQIGREKE